MYYLRHDIKDLRSYKCINITTKVYLQSSVAKRLRSIGWVFHVWMTLLPVMSSSDMDSWSFDLVEDVLAFVIKTGCALLPLRRSCTLLWSFEPNFQWNNEGSIILFQNRLPLIRLQFSARIDWPQLFGNIFRPFPLPGELFYNFYCRTLHNAVSDSNIVQPGHGPVKILRFT